MELPPYQSRYGHGEQAYMQPCDTTDAVQYVFVVPADALRMTASAQGFLGAPTGGRVSFEAVGDCALVHFVRAPRLTSLGQRVGYVVDRETAVSMPLAMRLRHPDRPDSYRLTTWMPYVLINSAGGCTAGREIFGFLKGIGEIAIPALDEPLNEWSAKTGVFRRMEPDCEEERAPLWTVRSRGAPARRAPLWTEVADFARFVEGALRAASASWTVLEAAELLWSAVELARSRTFPTTNLKQFRDARDGTRATCQELVTAPMVVSRLRGGGMLEGDFELILPRYASHDVPGDLGLVGGSGDAWPVRAAFYIEFDFTVPSGQVEWRWGG